MKKQIGKEMLTICGKYTCIFVRYTKIEILLNFAALIACDKFFNIAN
jgi:hypothetical protein